MLGQGGITSIEARLGNEIRDMTAFASRFSWIESLLGGGFSWSIRFASDHWGEWSKLLLGAEDPSWAWRLRQQEGGADKATLWRAAIVDGSSTGFSSTAMYARVHGGDRGLLMRQRARTRAWPASSVASVAQTIASEYDLAASVGVAGPTRDRWQVREDDWSFLVRLNAENAAEGRGDSFVWIDEDTLHLGAPPIAGIPADRRHVMAEYENRVDRHVLTFSGREVDRAGGATTRGVGFNFETGAPVSFLVDAAATQTQPALARRVPRPQAGGLRVLPVTEQTSPLVENAARATWGRAGPRYFTLRVDSRPDFLLRPGTILEMDANLDPQRQTPLQGRFLVLEVAHEVKDGAARTTAVCFRREAFEGEEDPSGVSAAAGGARDNYRASKPDQPRVTIVARGLG